MTERTVVAWNGSAPSDAALDWAIARERARHGSIDPVRIAESAALLVVGTRQRHGLARAWMGSVSHAVIIEIVCPTAVIAPEEEHE